MRLHHQRHGVLPLLVGSLLLLPGGGGELRAQVPQLSDLSRKWVLGPDGEPVEPELGRRPSHFQLFSDKDFARAFMTPGASISGSVLELCWENWPDDEICPYGIFRRVRSDNVLTLAYRQGDYFYGVPRTEWLKHRQKVQSLANAKGRGYNVFTNTSSPLFILPKDGTVGILHSGVTAQADGTCKDTHRWLTGDPLLPLSDCPVTWGSAGWRGAQLIAKEDYEAAFRANGNSFTFDYWRMPGAYAAGSVDAGRLLGSWQGYGVSSDWSIDKAALYGNVVPRGSGEPQVPGWPLGLEIRSDAFVYALPTLAGVLFVQALIINRSEDVYGVPLDYDSLYFGFSPSWWFHSSLQTAAQYWEPATGAFKAATTEEKVGCPNARADRVTDILCPGLRGIIGGSRHGAAMMMVLKSPIGDLRNKLFTRAGSPFYNPSHPSAGDTITFQHGHMCGFRACVQTTYNRWADPDGEQRMFGMIASVAADVAGARNLNDPTSFSDRDYWHTLRSERFPERSGFNRYVPGTWDWNHDGKPDTLYLDSCGSKGCVAAWSDTLPGGWLNGYGNVGVTNTVGPIRLAAGDTTGYIWAFAVAPEGAAQLDQFVKNITDMYFNFFKGPSAAALTIVRGVDVSSTRLGRRVSLFLDDSQVRKWTDQFLLDQAAALEGSRPAALNPTLLADIRARARDNVEAVHLLKSCDGGDTFTDDNDCEGDEAKDGKFKDLGWFPYKSWAANQVPSAFTDETVTPGRTYLYVLVSETRGASFPVVEDGPGGTFKAGSLDLAPKIFNPISRAADAPQVARVYVTASLQAGAQRASATLAAQSGPAKVAPDGFEILTITPATDAPTAGAYRVLFADDVTVVRTETYETAALAKLSSVTTRIDAKDKATGQTILSTQVQGADGITLSGESSSQRTVEGRVVSIVSTFKQLTAMLLRGTNVPLLASAVLDGEKTTPGAFIGRADFPGILLNVKHSPGTLAGSFYMQREEKLDPLTSPAVGWRSASVRPGPAARYGELVFDWEADAFGPAAPFALNFANPQATADALAQSVRARPAAQRTLAASQPVLDLAKAALRARGSRADSLRANALVAADIVQAALPFTIRNATFNANVDAIMLKRSADVRRLGSGPDTLTVAVPSDIWLPGDDLILVENTGAGNAVTWATAALGCDPGSVFRPLTCNPVSGRGSTFYVATNADHRLHVQYYVGFSTRSQFTFDVRAAKVAAELTAEEIRTGLEDVKAVPNPFMSFSQLVYPGTERDEAIVFTHLPPRGRLRIYTVAGHFVQELTWEAGDLAQTQFGATTSGQGDLFFNLRTREGNRMASGLYLFVVTALGADGSEIGSKIGKFVIIR